MGSIFKKQMTKSLPAGATIATVKGQRVARWRGKLRTAMMSKTPGRIVIESRVYFAKYRDGSGAVQTVSTGCRDKQAAQAKLADMEQTAERVRAGILTATEAAVALERDKPLTRHIHDYLAHLGAAGCSAEHRANVRRQLIRIATECRFSSLADLNRQAFEKWLVKKLADGMSARTRNCQLIVVTAFCNWCSHDAVRRLAGKPFAGIPMLNEKADPRRKRRALTEEELTKLLVVTTRRPLREARLVRRGNRKGQEQAIVRPETVERLKPPGAGASLDLQVAGLDGAAEGRAGLTLCRAGPRRSSGPISRTRRGRREERERGPHPSPGRPRCRTPRLARREARCDPGRGRRP